MLTARAAHTLLTYLSEINKSGVGGLYRLNQFVTHSLKPPGANP
jgi:hypothetical protein